MANKKKSWFSFSLVKRFFSSDSHSKQEKKEKRRKWIFGRLRIKRLASLAAPPPQQVTETEEKQSNSALSAAIATANAASAADAAAEAARLTEILEDFRVESLAQHTSHKEIHEFAAIKIQTAFRGYLAKKALRALKGIVTLQAIIRGRAVRRQAVTTLKRLQSIINIQSQVCANRFQTTEGTATYDYDDDYDEGDDQLQSLRNKILRMDSYNQKRWDDSLLSKEDADALFMSKREAMLKRERIKEYWHTHRKSAETDRNKVNGRWRYWLEQWVDTQLTKSKELEDLDTDLGSNTRKLRIRNLQNQNNNNNNEGGGGGFMESPPMFVPRKSLHRKQCSLGDENSFAGSPIVPTYMAATESARAKARSLSSPKLRPESLDGYSPCKHKLSLVSSITSDVPISSSNSTVGRPGGDYFHQRSPSMKGVRGPVKSSRKMINDLSIDSECSLSHWHHAR